MTEFLDIVDVNSTMESDSHSTICESRTQLVQQACKRLKELCRNNILKKEKSGELPDELVFEWVDVFNDLKNFLNKYDKDNILLGYSLRTIFEGGFTTDSGKIKRNKIRDAGVTNPFVLDVKRAMADKCVKVWDISDKKFSKKKVWKITIFIHEIRKLKDEEPTISP